MVIIYGWHQQLLVNTQASGEDKEENFKITGEANKKIVQFLDVEFNLNEETFRPYIKTGDVPLYPPKQRV